MYFTQYQWLHIIKSIFFLQINILSLHACQMGMVLPWESLQRLPFSVLRMQSHASVVYVDDSYLQGDSYESNLKDVNDQITMLRSLGYTILLNTLWLGFNCLTATEPLWGDSFYNLVPRSSWYLIDQPWKDESLSWPRSHPVLLNLGTLDWEFSTLTTKPHPEELVLKPTQSLIYLSFIINSEIDRREKTNNLWSL